VAETQKLCTAAADATGCPPLYLQRRVDGGDGRYRFRSIGQTVFVVQGAQTATRSLQPPVIEAIQIEADFRIVTGRSRVSGHLTCKAGTRRHTTERQERKK
jgi:hypothetical protein